MNKDKYDSLTEAEVDGLGYRYNFADGHAYHDIDNSYISIINDLSEYWNEGKAISIPEMEESFKDKYAKLINSEALYVNNNFSVCPTASNSIDIVAAWLHKENKRTALIEPAFDNLYLLLKRRNVDVVSFNEKKLKDREALLETISTGKIDALFLVNPNNPTGLEMTEDEFIYLVKACERNKITILLDRTFRLYGNYNFDDYKILDEYDVDYILIEDTGKTWPTQDMKISLMVYSASIGIEVRKLYEEIYLCSSNFSLAILKKFIEITTILGTEKTIKAEVRKRYEMIKLALSKTKIKFIENEDRCQLPFCWVDISNTQLSDIEFCAKLKEYNIAVLPGRYFYWNSKDENTQFIRISLMKPNKCFYEGVDYLEKSVSDISKNIR